MRKKRRYDMAFWEDLQKGVNDVAAFTSKKTTELTGLAKLKYAIHVCEQKLDKCFTEIGRLFYESQKDGADHSAEIATLIMQIDKLTSDLALHNAEIMKLKNAVTCTSCGSEIAKECIFCPICGKKMDEEEKSEDTTED